MTRFRLLLNIVVIFNFLCSFFRELSLHISYCLICPRGQKLAGAQQGKRNGMTPINHPSPIWFPSFGIPKRFIPNTLPLAPARTWGGCCPVGFPMQQKRSTPKKTCPSHVSQNTFRKTRAFSLEPRRERAFVGTPTGRSSMLKGVGMENWVPHPPPSSPSIGREPPAKCSFTCWLCSPACLPLSLCCFFSLGIYHWPVFSLISKSRFSLTQTNRLGTFSVGTPRLGELP